MQNKVLQDHRTYAGELLLAVRIAKQLTAIHAAGVLDEAVDWCRRRLREHEDELSQARWDQNMFGTHSRVAQAMVGLGVGSEHTIAAACWAAQECQSQKLIIDELNNFCEYYRIPMDLPTFPARRKRKVG
jgi:hypothetical protein